MVGFQEAAQEVAVDSLAGFTPESPLPLGAAGVFRWFFNVPQGIQIGGAIIGGAVAIWVVRRLWKARHAIIEWFRTRSAELRRGILIASGVALLAIIVAGARTWQFMQHDNDFCTACHVMTSAFDRFNASEHGDLNCHDCHNQSVWASTKQMVMWVMERPVEIRHHTPLANAICEDCHVTGQDSASWQQVQLSAGHRVHFESDSTALDDLLCVTCHGAEVHRFVPANQTCGQADCHDDIGIELAAMADQTSQHCAACHRFTEAVPALATTDSARATLIPALAECQACHQMVDLLVGYDPVREPHDSRCGTCHNPHAQVAPEDALITCIECHDDWEARPFHVGANHASVGEECALCHEYHASRADASGCAGCHQMVMDREDIPAAMRERLRRAMPFDTAAALRNSATGVSLSHPTAGHQGREVAAPSSSARHVTARRSAPRTGGGWPLAGWVGVGAGAEMRFARGVDPPAAAPDTFSHAQHESLTCLNCHNNESGETGLTFAEPRGCQICHHQAPRQSECSTCHASESLAAALPISFTLTVSDSLTRHRQIELLHVDHDELDCLDCHTEPVSLSSTDAVATCMDCHDEHHGADLACADCHGSAADRRSFEVAHAPRADAHTGCDVCHAGSTVALLNPDEQFCRGCHLELEPEHYVASGRDCTTCHMLASTAGYRPRLMSGGGGR